MKIFGVVGWKNSGKTTLVERLIGVFLNKGITVSTIKHSHHNFQIDKEGKDSFRHRKAGANETILASNFEWVKFSTNDPRTQGELDFYLNQLKNVDLVLVEGFKDGSHQKIEVFDNKSGKQPIFLSDKSICAVACADQRLNCSLPVFDRNETEEISDYIIKVTKIEV